MYCCKYTHKLTNYGSNNLDLVIYDHPHYIFYDNYDPNVDRSRLFVLDGDYLVPNRTYVSLSKFIESRRRSILHAKSKIFNFALSNSWRYFVTLTFSPDQVDRSDRVAVNLCWKKFRQHLQSIFPNITILNIPEYHNDGKSLHFHVLLGGEIDLSDYLIRAKNPAGDLIFTQRGDDVYNFDPNFYFYGFSTVVRTDNNVRAISYYLTKYAGKNIGDQPYNAKRYYHTHNLVISQAEYDFVSCPDIYIQRLIERFYGARDCCDIELIDSDKYSVIEFQHIYNLKSNNIIIRKTQLLRI